MATDSAIRRETLKKVCIDRGWIKRGSASEVSPTALAQAIGKAVSYCSDLLHGRASFGEEIARHIEGILGLSPFYLDGYTGVTAVSREGAGGWPFPGIDPERFVGLDPVSLGEIQGKVREMLERMESESLTTNKGKRGAA